MPLDEPRVHAHQDAEEEQGVDEQEQEVDVDAEEGVPGVEAEGGGGKCAFGIFTSDQVQSVSWLGNKASF